MSDDIFAIGEKLMGTQVVEHARKIGRSLVEFTTSAFDATDADEVAHLVVKQIRTICYRRRIQEGDGSEIAENRADLFTAMVIEAANLALAELATQSGRRLQ